MSTPNHPASAPPLDTAATTTGGGQLSRSLGVGGNVLITLSGISPASSVFILGGAAFAGYGTGVFWGFIIAGVISLLVALCYAELGSRHPLAGGDYTLVSRVLGPAPGAAVFFIGLISLPLIVAIFALGVADYLGVAIAGLDPLWTAVIVIALATATACFNIRTNAWVTGAFLFIEMAALAYLTFLGVIHIERPLTDLLNPQALNDAGGLAPLGIAGLVLAVTQGIFSYNGYGGAIYFAEETKDARRTIARALLWSALITVLAEIIPLTAIMLGADTLEELFGADLPVESFLSARTGDAVSTVILVTIALAIVNAIIAIALQAGRLLFAAARDGAMPPALSRRLSRISSRTRMPVAATITMGVIALIGCFIPFDVLLNATGSTLAFSYGFIALAALIVRRQPSVTGSYRMPLWPVPPVVALLAIGTIFVIGILDPAQWLSLGISTGIIAAGFLYYAVYLRANPGAIHLLEADASDDLSEECSA
ncbi:APC family permease [Microbacterium maritypicum]|uniref:APC family permease n=1 Tax=Microbacterium maritypicum TaxID=33918 RepID=A0AAJ5VAM6_MICMQ|nr:APC family permease [Microbacterium liquefaciens]WEF20732.1 APC family permease [Microbacterium liquefaciens]